MVKYWSSFELVNKARSVFWFLNMKNERKIIFLNLKILCILLLFKNMYRGTILMNLIPLCSFIPLLSFCLPTFPLLFPFLSR